MEIRGIVLTILLQLCLKDGKSLSIWTASPYTFGFSHSTFKLYGSGFVVARFYKAEFYKKDCRKLYSCYAATSTRLDCDLNSGPGSFNVNQTGFYRVTVADSLILPALVYVHNETLTITDVYSRDGLLNRTDVYNVLGRTKIDLVLGGDAYISFRILVRFHVFINGVESYIIQPISTNKVSTYNPRGDFIVHTETPRLATPIGWTKHCDYPVVPDHKCAPPLLGGVAVSLDGFHYSPSVPMTFGYFRPQMLAFLCSGQTSDFGLALALNIVRSKLEREFREGVNVSNVTQGLVEGNWAFLQPNRGRTSVTGTPVESFIKGQPNPYYEAFHLMDELCLRKFDIVFTFSLGFEEQTMDASFLPNCIESHTKLVNIGGSSSTRGASSGSAKVYQAKYLTGLVAGADLYERKAAIRRRKWQRFIYAWVRWIHC